MKGKKKKSRRLPRKRKLHFKDNIRSPSYLIKIRVYRYRCFSRAMPALHNMAIIRRNDGPMVHIHKRPDPGPLLAQQLRDHRPDHMTSLPDWLLT